MNRKRITVHLSVSAPEAMPASAIRREVKTRINALSSHYDWTAHERWSLTGADLTDQGEIRIVASDEKKPPAKLKPPNPPPQEAPAIETAMALWEAVLDARAAEAREFLPDPPLARAFDANGYMEMRRMATALIPAADEAWGSLQLDFDGAWDWEFLPLVVALWIEADFDASAVTVEKIVAAATEKEE